MGKRICCEHCGRTFVPDRYNASRQKFCLDSACARERKRKRQREWYSQRRQTDAAFRAQENARCTEANRQRRAAAAKTDVASERRPDIELPHLVTGLLSQLADSVDPFQVQALARRYADRGRRLALSTLYSSGEP